MPTCHWSVFGIRLNFSDHVTKRSIPLHQMEMLDIHSFHNVSRPGWRTGGGRVEKNFMLWQRRCVSAVFATLPKVDKLIKLIIGDVINLWEV